MWKWVILLVAVAGVTAKPQEERRYLPPGETPKSTETIEPLDDDGVPSPQHGGGARKFDGSPEKYVDRLTDVDNFFTADDNYRSQVEEVEEFTGRNPPEDYKLRLRDPSRDVELVDEVTSSQSRSEIIPSSQYGVAPERLTGGDIPSDSSYSGLNKSLPASAQLPGSNGPFPAYSFNSVKNIEDKSPSTESVGDNGQRFVQDAQPGRASQDSSSFKQILGDNVPSSVYNPLSGRFTGTNSPSFNIDIPNGHSVVSDSQLERHSQDSARPSQLRGDNEPSPVYGPSYGRFTGSNSSPPQTNGYYGQSFASGSPSGRLEEESTPSSQLASGNGPSSVYGPPSGKFTGTNSSPSQINGYYGQSFSSGSPSERLAEYTPRFSQLGGGNGPSPLDSLSSGRQNNGPSPQLREYNSPLSTGRIQSSNENPYLRNGAPISAVGSTAQYTSPSKSPSGRLLGGNEGSTPLDTYGRKGFSSEISTSSPVKSSAPSTRLSNNFPGSARSYQSSKTLKEETVPSDQYGSPELSALVNDPSIQSDEPPSRRLGGDVSPLAQYKKQNYNTSFTQSSRSGGDNGYQYESPISSNIFYEPSTQFRTSPDGQLADQDSTLFRGSEFVALNNPSTESGTRSSNSYGDEDSQSYHYDTPVSRVLTKNLSTSSVIPTGAQIDNQSSQSGSLASPNHAGRNNSTPRRYNSTTSLSSAPLLSGGNNSPPYQYSAPLVDVVVDSPSSQLRDYPSGREDSRKEPLGGDSGDPVDVQIDDPAVQQGYPGHLGDDSGQPGQNNTPVPTRGAVPSSLISPTDETGTAYNAIPDQLLDPLYKPADYEFSYRVLFPPTGTDFGHHERRVGQQTQGEYFVLLPDGRTQVVEYEADQGGYKPSIRYEGSRSSSLRALNSAQPY